MRFLSFARSVVLTVSCCAPLGTSLAQCERQWLPGEGVAGVDGAINSMVGWDPDGPGPRETVLVVGGSFFVAGSTPANNIAVWDGAEWSALGRMTGGYLHNVHALAALANGELVAGGRFRIEGDSTDSYLARWDGTGWTSLSGGMNGDVHALKVLSNGDLVVGGKFTTAGGVSVNSIARWELTRSV